MIHTGRSVSSRARLCALLTLTALAVAPSFTWTRASAQGAAPGMAPAMAPAMAPIPVEKRLAASDFEANDLKGKSVKLSQYKGKVVILDFWATWCPPCKKGIPELMQLHAEHQKAGLEVIGLSLDDKGAAVVQPFVDKNAVNYTMLLIAPRGPVAQTYVPSGRIPTMHILDRQGRIAQTIVGLVPKETIAGIVKTLLEEKS